VLSLHQNITHKTLLAMKTAKYSLMALLLCCVNVLLAQGINFAEGDWKSVLAKAKNSNKLIFVDVYTTWCGPCKMMARDVFPNEKVGSKFNASFVNYKIDAEKGEGIDLARKYNVRAYPNFLFINGDGELVHRVIGYHAADEFLEQAEVAVKKVGDKPLSWFESNYPARRKDPQFMLAYLDKLESDEKDPSKVLNDYLSDLKPEQQTEEANVLLAAKYLHSMEGLPFNLVMNGLKSADKYQASTREALEMSALKLIDEKFSTAVQENDRMLMDKIIGTVRAVRPITAESMVNGMELEFAKAGNDQASIAKYSERMANDLMKKTPAELKKQDAETFKSIMSSFRQSGQDTTSEMFKARVNMLKSASTNAVAGQLNSLAWGYAQSMSDKASWKKALAWSARSLELMPTEAALMDTYANLLYKLGKKKKALQYQEMAVKTAPDDESLKETLEKIKKNTL
jgi:thioredoxin-related protein